jgi:hypothetical protein
VDALSTLPTCGSSERGTPLRASSLLKLPLDPTGGGGDLGKRDVCCGKPQWEGPHSDLRCHGGLLLPVVGLGVDVLAMVYCHRTVLGVPRALAAHSLATIGDVVSGHGRAEGSVGHCRQLSSPQGCILMVWVMVHGLGVVPVVLRMPSWSPPSPLSPLVGLPSAWLSETVAGGVVCWWHLAVAPPLLTRPRPATTGLGGRWALLVAVVSTTVGVGGGLLGRVLAVLQWRDWRWPVDDAPRMSWWRSWLFEATFHATVCWWRRSGPTVVFAPMFVNGAMVVVMVATVRRPNSNATVVWLPSFFSVGTMRVKTLPFLGWCRWCL